MYRILSPCDDYFVNKLNELNNLNNKLGKLKNLYLYNALIMKILLVEDNELNRDMLSRRLIRRGYDIIMAEDGAKGVEMAINAKPDLILMDLSLPVLDGWNATKK